MLGSTLGLEAFRRKGLLWGAGYAGEPHDLLHGHTDSLGEGGYLSLEVYQEGI